MEKRELLKIIEQLGVDDELRDAFRDVLIRALDLRKNPFHPLAFINGDPEIGENTSIGFYSEINAKGGLLRIGRCCDIASFVSINVADSHKKAIGLSNEIERFQIVLDDNVFVGSHSFIGGNTKIGANSVIAAGTVLIHGGEIPPYSLIWGNPANIRPGYYLARAL